MKKIIASTAAALLTSLTLTAQAAPHSAGTTIKDPSGTIYFITLDGQRRPYTSAGAFLSYGRNSFGTVAEATADDLALPIGAFIPPQDGKIICSDRGSDKGTCYLISQAAKVGFPSADIFIGQGFSFSNALYGDTSFLPYTSNIQSGQEAHRPGVLINNSGTIQLVGPSGVLGIPTMDTFLSWGYSLKDVVPANTADKQFTQSGVMAAYSPGLISPLATAAASSANPPASSSAANPLPTPLPPPSQTATGAVSITLDSTAPASQNIIMSATSVPLTAIKFQETSGNEAVQLSGLTISAIVSGGTTIGNGTPNTGYDTLKNFTLTNGTQSISRTSWSSQTPARTGPGIQNYDIDFSSGSPLAFTIPASGSLTLTLKADVNDWPTDAAANSAWTFQIKSTNSVTLLGKASGAAITPSLSSNALSNTTTILEQPLSIQAVSSSKTVSNTVTNTATGSRNSQEIVGIFTVSSPSSQAQLTSLTLAQSGTAITTSPTPTPTTYYIYDALHDIIHPVGIGSVTGSGSVTIPLNLNAAATSGGIAVGGLPSVILVEADTSNFTACTTNCTGPTYSYNLTLNNWQWNFSPVPGGPFTGPTTNDTSKAAVFSGGATTKLY